MSNKVTKLTHVTRLITFITLFQLCPQPLLFVRNRDPPFFVLFLLNSQFTIPFKRDQKQGIDYLALAAESKTVSKKLNIRRSVERLKTKLPRSITRLPIYDREQILAEIDSELPDGVIDQSTDKLQYLNQLIDDTDPILLMPPESEVYLIKKVVLSDFFKTKL